MKHIVTTSELTTANAGGTASANGSAPRDEPQTTGPLPPIWQVARDDLRAASGFGILAVACLLVWMAFQWGFGNDTVLPWLSALTFDAVDDRETWGRGLSAIGLTALTGFTFWAVSQALDAVVMLAGLKLVPGLTQRLSIFLRRKGWVSPYDELKLSTRWIMAYGAGASIPCLVDFFATGEQGIQRRKRMIIESTLLSAGSVGIVIALVAFAAVLGVRIPATASGAETFIRYARNPLTWIVILGLVFVANHAFGRDDPENDEEVEPELPGTA